jgi:hypothetical protein
MVARERPSCEEKVESEKWTERNGGERSEKSPQSTSERDENGELVENSVVVGGTSSRRTQPHKRALALCVVRLGSSWRPVVLFRGVFFGRCKWAFHEAYHDLNDLV